MGAAMTPRRSAGETSAETDQAHWGRQPPIGVGNLPTPMLRFLPRCAERPGRFLPQCTERPCRSLPQYAGQRRAPASPTYPNAPFPAPMHRTACGSSGGAGSRATPCPDVLNGLVVPYPAIRHRPSMPRARAHCSTASPLTQDGSTRIAVERASASTPDPARTLTWRAPPLAGRPVRGSMMWWASNRSTRRPPGHGAPPDVPRSTPPDAPRSTPPDAPRSTPPDAPRSTPPDAPRSTPPGTPRRAPRGPRSAPSSVSRGVSRAPPFAWLCPVPRVHWASRPAPGTPAPSSPRAAPSVPRAPPSHSSERPGRPPGPSRLTGPIRAAGPSRPRLSPDVDRDASPSHGSSMTEATAVGGPSGSRRPTRQGVPSGRVA